MKQNTEPDFYNDLTLSLARARSLLERGSTDRKSPVHNPVVGTVDADGAPQQRIMILRKVDWVMRQLRFHTDIRTEKVMQLSENSRISILVYHPSAKIQLRLTGTARVEVGGIADEPWAQSTPFARRCYMAEAAPGSVSAGPTSGLPDWIEGKMPEISQLQPARANFALLLSQFDQIEWLYLAQSGHRRAQFEHHNGEWQGQWLIP